MNGIPLRFADVYDILFVLAAQSRTLNTLDWTVDNKPLSKLKNFRLSLNQISTITKNYED